MIQEENTHAPPKPNKPRKTGYSIEIDQERLTYIRKQGGAGGGCFMSIWLAGWTVGCVMLAVGAFSGEHFLFIFGIPFWAAEVFVAFFVLNAFFGKEKLELSPEGLSWQHLVLRKAIRHKVAPLSELLSVEEVIRNQGSSGGPDYKLRFNTTGKGFDFASNLNNDQREYLAWQLNSHLKHLQTSAGLEPPQVMEADADSMTLARDKHDDTVTKPSDCRWSMHTKPGEMGDAFQLHMPGQFELKSFGLLLFINLFWNGIVSVFLCALWGLTDVKWENGDDMVMFSGSWWCMFVFLIPFQVIGLLFLVGLLNEMTAPIRRTILSFEDDLLKKITTFLGVPYTRRVSLSAIHGVIVTSNEDKKEKKTFDTQINEEEDDNDKARIVFIDNANEEITSIKKLTLGEARWMAQEIAKQYRNVEVADRTR